MSAPAHAAIPGACRVALVLAGGNALGAYQAGVYQALHEGGIAPHWIVGTSAGAINGAIIAGNAPDQRLARLAAFWRPAAPDAGADWWATSDTWRRTSEAVFTLLAGRSGMFGPAGTSLLGGRTPALYDTSPMTATLEPLIDRDRLNDGTVRYTATAVDLDSGDEVAFDSLDRTIGIEHVRASAALPPTFPAMEVDGRLFVDGGLSANLPLDPVLGGTGADPTLCIAVDLLPAAAPRPETLGDMIERTQDLIFASQSRRTIARWTGAYATDHALRDRSVTLVRLAYADQRPEVAGKAMDFSPASARHRWDAGHRDAAEFVRRLHTGTIAIGAPGLTVVAPQRES